MILGIEGEEATAKTTTAFTAPLPIRGFALDMGYERAIFGSKYEEFFKGLKIQVVKYVAGEEMPMGDPDSDIIIYVMPTPIQVDSVMVHGCREMWNAFVVRVVECLQDPKVRTVVFDTMTSARRLKAQAYLQGLQERDKNEGKPVRKQLIQIEYGAANDAIRDIFNTGQALGKNMVATHHLTNEYTDHVNAKGEVERITTGRRVLEGLSGTHQFVDIAILNFKKDKKIKAKYLKCGYELDIEGTEQDDPSWDRITNLVSMRLGDRIQFDKRKDNGS